MTFTTGTLVINKNKQPVIKKGFSQVEEIPGYEQLAKDELIHVINFLHNNLENTAICLQAVYHNSSNHIVYDNNDTVIAAYGWHIIKHLGRGKDGFTCLAYKYDDHNCEIKTVKILSRYAQNYLNHTEIFSEIFKQLEKRNNNYFRLNVHRDYTFYDYSVPLHNISDENFIKTLGILCKMNSWIMQTTGFVFWDFGFNSGKNYMVDDYNIVRWIDYGGSGLLRCPNFEYVYNKYKDLPELQLIDPLPGKESLLIANSDFLLCQFLLHIEYWNNSTASNADVWSSMLQIRKSAVTEFKESMLPNILYTKLSKTIYNEFKNSDLTDYITWKQLGKFIDANS